MALCKNNGSSRKRKPTKGFQLILILILSVFGAQRLWAQGTATKTVRISFEIEPVMTMQVASEAGVSAVRLGPLSPNEQAPPQALEVSVITNLHQRYQVFHSLQEGITEASGEEFPRDRLLFMVTAGKGEGTSLISGFTQVPTSEVPIFSSGSGGGSDLFHILYSVDNSELFSAGAYYGNITVDIRTE